MEQVFLFIGGIFWTILSGVTIYLFTKQADHEKRVQRIEDVQGSKIDNLTSDLKEFKESVTHKLDALTHMVHREKNQENQLNQTLALILKELTKNHEG